MSSPDCCLRGNEAAYPRPDRSGSAAPMRRLWRARCSWRARWNAALDCADGLRAGAQQFARPISKFQAVQHNLQLDGGDKWPRPARLLMLALKPRRSTTLVQQEFLVGSAKTRAGDAVENTWPWRSPTR